MLLYYLLNLTSLLHFNICIFIMLLRFFTQLHGILTLIVIRCFRFNYFLSCASLFIMLCYNCFIPFYVIFMLPLLHIFKLHLLNLLDI